MRDSFCKTGDRKGGMADPAARLGHIAGSGNETSRIAHAGSTAPPTQHSKGRSENANITENRIV